MRKLICPQDRHCDKSFSIMAFLDVKEYHLPSSHYRSHFFLYALLAFMPAVSIIYFTKTTNLDPNNGLHIILVAISILIVAFSGSLIKGAINTLRVWLRERALSLTPTPIKVWIPANTTQSNYLALHPSKLILRDSTLHPSKLILRDPNGNYPVDNQNFLILNTVSYDNTNAEIIKPYYDMILCKELFCDERILWSYFIIAFFFISLVVSIYSFSIVLLLKAYIVSFWLQILLFFVLLSLLFGYMLYLFVHNISIEECSKDKIFQSIKDTFSDPAYTINSTEDLDREFSIYKNGDFFSQKDALNSIETIKEDLTEKIKNIFQMTAPIFYLANITLGIAYLTY